MVRMNMSNFLIALVIVVLAGGGYYWYTKSSASHITPSTIFDEVTNTDPAAVQPQSPPKSAGTAGGSGTPAGTLKEFTITGKNFSFVPNTMTVSKGDTVKITFKNTGGFHDLRVEGYDVGTAKIQDGQSDTFTFVANTTGSFEYYCSVGTHRAMGMKGTLVVTE